MIFLFKSHFHTSRLQIIIHFAANYFLPPSHLICIKQSLFTIMKAFLAKWSLVNIVQIPHLLTEKLPPDSLWVACGLQPCCVWPAEGFAISQLYIKEFLCFPFFKLNDLIIQELILAGQQLAGSDDHLPALDMAYHLVCHGAPFLLHQVLLPYLLVT